MTDQHDESEHVRIAEGLAFLYSVKQISLKQYEHLIECADCRKAIISATMQQRRKHSNPAE